jgi:hypothetical protein
MRITKCGEYALRALIELGLAEESSRPVIQSSVLGTSPWRGDAIFSLPFKITPWSRPVW